MNYRKVLGYVAVMAGFTAVLFAWDSLWVVLAGSKGFDLKELIVWLGVSVLVLAVSVLVLAIDFVLWQSKGQAGRN